MIAAFLLIDRIISCAYLIALWAIGFAVQLKNPSRVGAINIETPGILTSSEGQLMNFNIEQGQLITLTFEGKEFEVIVIDPNGLGKGQPSVGFGFRMMQKHGGLPEQTLSNWLTKESGFESDPNNEVLALKLPSGNRFRAT